ncbi:diguanylate cyclase [Svornostia abyssi]|uniref:Diguanylate cyclase n=1 Tax=Svornostia abyssi TaxID=2898438 RepID=A0ABY5PKY1_9ACTN|nr:diguanylate cyclase [Parviterribacteraceae bacterium J379]
MAIRPIAGLPVRVSVGVASAGSWNDHGLTDRVRSALARARRAGGNAAVSDERGLVTPDEERFGPRKLTAPNADVTFAPPSWWSVLTRSDPEPAAAPVPTPPNPSTATPPHEVADAPTGALSADALAWHAAELAQRSAQNGVAVALIVTDLDGSAALGERFGASALSDVLREVARRVGEQAPAYRTGADAFTTVLVGDDARRAFAVAERIRASTAAASAGALTLSASVGVASAPPGSFELAELNRRAVAAQAAARAGGGDQVRLDGTAAPAPVAGTARALRAA